MPRTIRCRCPDGLSVRAARGYVGRVFLLHRPYGRRLAVSEYGDPVGRPVFFLHGTPSSRLERYLDANALGRLGVRLLTYDRPGYGQSDPDPGRTVGSAAGDVAAVADVLGLDRFSVYGASGGGPHALACGARLSHRVDRVAAMVSPAPYDAPGLDFTAGMTASNVEEFGTALEGRDALAALLGPMVELARADPNSLWDALAKELPESDQRVIARPEVHDALATNLAESVATSMDGWLDDDLAFVRPWGFALADITVPVLLWHGADDVLAPVSHSEYLAEHVPGAIFVRPAGVGHFGAVDAHPDVIAWLLDEPVT